VAVLRDETSNAKRRSPISKVNYDFFTHSIQSDGTDGAWQVANPIDDTTGLLYDPKSYNDGASSSSADSSDWYDLMQTFLRHGYDSALQSSTEDHPLLMIERAYNPPPIRQQMLECLFEELNVPATFLGKDAVMSCYGCGRVTATVVDIGYSGTTVSPVYEGFVEQKGIRSSPAGVRAMDEYLLEQMDALNKQRGPIMPLYQVRRPQKDTRRLDIHHAARLFLTQQCREMGVGAAINTTQTSGGFHAPHKSFELPDGTMLDIPSSTRFAVSDLLFGSDSDSIKRREDLFIATREKLSSYITSIPTESEGDDMDTEDDDKFSEAAAVGISKRKTKRAVAGAAAESTKRTGFSNRILQKACSVYLQNHLDHLTSSPIASMICDAAYRCDRDQQVALLGTVIIGGGGSCLGPTDQAVPDLVREQVEGIIHQHTPGWRLKVLTPGFQERSVLSWLGGSILGSLGTFHEMWITKAEYEEWGTAIVNRKCP
jgi:actin-related protein